MFNHLWLCCSLSTERPFPSMSFISAVPFLVLLDTTALLCVESFRVIQRAGESKRVTKTM